MVPQKSPNEPVFLGEAKPLAKGACGQLLKVIRDGVTRAIKLVKPGEHYDVLARLLRYEAEAVIDAGHVDPLHFPRDARFYKEAQIEREGKVQLVNEALEMEFIEGINLLNFIKKVGSLSPYDTFLICTHVIAALSKMHELGLTHNDVKPENVMLTLSSDKKLSVKLVDFTLVENVRRQSPHPKSAIVGSVGYMSPEQLAGARKNFRNDLFAVGVIMYESLTAYKLFESRDIEMYRIELEKWDHTEPNWLGFLIPAEVKQIIRRLLQVKGTVPYTSTEEAARDCAKMTAEKMDPELRLQEPFYSLLGRATSQF